MPRFLERSRGSVAQAQPPGTVHVEAGTNGSRIDGADRVAVVAHWDPDGRVRRSPRTLVGALVEAGYATILVSTADGAAPLGWTDGRPGDVTVLRRPNLGYDFGSWATAMETYPSLRTARMVLLMNDSLAGPFAPIDHLLGRFHRSTAQVWAMTDTEQLGHHLQSYCLGFKDGCLGDRPLRRFWTGIRAETTRDEVIERYELGLSRILRRARYSTDVAIEGWRVVDGDDNPTIIGWRRLLDLGFPFVKRQVLREPDICPDGAAVARELRRRFGVEAADWM